MADMLPLHGAAAVGEVRIFAEVHPDSVCESVAKCAFLAPKGSKDALSVKASRSLLLSTPCSLFKWLSAT